MYYIRAAGGRLAGGYPSAETAPRLATTTQQACEGMIHLTNSDFQQSFCLTITRTKIRLDKFAINTTLPKRRLRINYEFFYL